MVYSSIPAYLDAANWQQQSNNQTIGSNNISSQLLPPPLPPSHPHAGGSSGSIRPGSMADRARMANIPMAEGPLKCPRCESTNTKFCYFNNYSLTQPRHFCKTCRRYWTRGGALRNVPVGGGCRRNKRRKGSSSKSPATSADCQTSTSSSTSTMSSMSADILGLTQPQGTPMRFMAPLHPDFGAGDIGLNYGGIHPAHLGPTNDLNVQHGSALVGGSASSLLSPRGVEQWRLQQPQHLPFFDGLDAPSTGFYSLENNSQYPGYPDGSGTSQVRPRLTSTSGVNTHLASVKTETNQGLNFSSQFFGASGNEQYWNGTGNTAWTDLSGFSSSSTGNLI